MMISARATEVSAMNIYKLDIEQVKNSQCVILLPKHLQERAMANPMTNSFYATAAGYFFDSVQQPWSQCLNAGEYLLIYCSKGSGAVTVAGRRYTLTPNSYLIVPPQVSYSFSQSDNIPGNLYWVSFNGGLAGGLYFRYMQHKGSAMQELSNCISNNELLTRFVALCHSFSFECSQQQLEGFNFQLLNFVTSIVYDTHLMVAQERSTTGTIGFVDASISFMQANLHDRFGIREFADQQNMSVKQYAALFKAKTGRSPMKYFNELKVTDACRYLETTDLSIKSISNQMSFNDQYYFSRLFRKLKGKSPVQYRQWHKMRKQA